MAGSLPALALDAREISKSFGATRALDHVGIAVHAGQVLALVGENGAGKSTLMNVICGALRPDAGTILLAGNQVQVQSPHHAMQLGITIVHQHSALVPALTVAENIFLGRLPQTPLGVVDWRTLFRKARELVSALDFELDVRRPVGGLTAAGRQVTEIARALSLEAKIIIMDEPSAVLGPSELERLFRIIRRLKAQGKAILYISHRLGEVFDIADRVTVLKDGRLVGTYEIDGTIDRDFLISRMVGREWSEQFPTRAAPHAEEALRIEGLTRHGVFEDVSFTLRAGEIVGMAGLVGAGRTDLCKAIFGAIPIDSGAIYVAGRLRRFRSPRDALAGGIAYVSEDRHSEGVVLCLPVGTNLTLPILHRFAPRWLLRRVAENRFCDELMHKVRLRAKGRQQIVSTLSGGNQQKISLGKWLETGAKIFMLDEPTVGIDVGAKREIYELVAVLARSGAAILMVSSEIPELLSMASRILVMRKGRISGELAGDRATEEEVLHYAT
jgi:ABC-type sugar transport system ATPase subunit